MKNGIFFLLNLMLIPKWTFKTICDSRSVLESNAPINYSLGKEHICNKVIISIIRSQGHCCYTVFILTILVMSSTSQYETNCSVSWMFWTLYIWLICAVTDSHCMMPFYIYYSREGKRNVIDVMKILDWIKSFIPLLSSALHVAFLQDIYWMNIHYMNEDTNGSMLKCTLAFLLSIREQCLEEACLGPDFIIYLFIISINCQHCYISQHWYRVWIILLLPN